MWIPGVEPGHEDFQTSALPAELNPRECAMKAVGLLQVRLRKRRASAAAKRGMCAVLHAQEAPPMGIEPMTFRLTTGRSSTEL